jgi:hypothetical protein
MNTRIIFAATLALVPAALALPAQPPPAAISTFESYVSSVESQLASRHRDPAAFLAPGTPVHPTDLVVQEIQAPFATGAMLHHWRGTAFAPGASATDFERLLRDFNSYPRQYAPQVLSARVFPGPDPGPGKQLQVSMRVRQKHVLTVVLDSTYDVTFAQLDPAHRYSLSRSVHISEIDDPGSARERSLTPAEEHGFLWRLNTYWTWEERDGGLYLQVETISLSRSIPHGLAWAVRPFVESVPRESLEFTLRCALTALRNPERK